MPGNNHRFRHSPMECPGTNSGVVDIFHRSFEIPKAHIESTASATSKKGKAKTPKKAATKKTTEKKPAKKTTKPKTPKKKAAKSPKKAKTDKPKKAKAAKK
ncbi:histone H1.4-like [Ylistrum balloti]|uniref:histone H1.4-like n=1 Tax=Ylistrum balloti TaxID=509963 RepID=UPI0029059161|nr:histone H1.4-like [Ylistrum balloti]